MTIVLPASAFFLPPRSGANNGVDFLGLRQPNLDMMADLIPSTNNVTQHIRPFSLLCWIFWKFHGLCEEANIADPSNKDLTAFRERIEVLFTWGARLVNYPGIPGKQAEPPAGNGPHPLTFADWHRVQSSTSLIAALWYGPAAKAVTGLGFLLPVPRRAEFYRTVERGIDLAKALDGLLRANQALYDRLLGALEPVVASEEDALALWELWSPDVTSEDEQRAFQSALFSEAAVGDYSSLIGKRSSTLALARLHIDVTGTPLSADAIRRGMFFSQTDGGDVYKVPDNLAGAHHKWVTLQVRQLQRYALENLLSWCEARILNDHRSDTEALADDFLREWQVDENPLKEAQNLAAAIGLLDEQFSSLGGFIEQCRAGAIPSPFSLIGEIATTSGRQESRSAMFCMQGALLCAAFAGCLPEDVPELRLGGSSRISLFHLRKRLLALGEMPLHEAFRFLLETMTISQHFATAVNRFDGANQRLRLAIEESGLCPLVNSPWTPNVTEDRLPTLLSLAAGCGILSKTEDQFYTVSA